MQLEMLSEVAGTVIGRSSRSVERPPGPPGFRGLKLADTPPEDRSLFEHYLSRFMDLVARGGTSRKDLWILLIDAEHALKRATVPPTEEERQRMVAGHLNRAAERDEDEGEKALIDHVITAHEDSSAYFVAVTLSVPVGWVERIREDAGRDPDYGRLRPQWRKLDAETKRSLVADQERLGKTQLETARVLGIGKRTVEQYWPRVAA